MSRPRCCRGRCRPQRRRCRSPRWGFHGGSPGSPRPSLHCGACSTSLPVGCRIVASGLWGSAPVGLALIGTGRSYTSWEHSVLPARLALDRRVAALHRLVGAAPVRPAAMIAVSQGVRRTLAERPGAPGRHRGHSERGRRSGTSSGASNACRRNSLPAHDRGFPGVQELLLRHRGSAAPSTGLPPHDGRRRAPVPGAESACGRTRGGGSGRVPGSGRRRRPAYLDRSHALVHPSLSETFGFSLVEAAADHGLPVATLPVPSVDELVPTYVPGVMAGALTPVALAAAVRR